MSINIALIRQEQTGTDGGAQAIIDLMIQALSNENNINVSLLCRKWDAKIHSHAQKVIIDPNYKGRQHKQSSFNSAVRSYLQQHSFDLIQSHERLADCHIFRAGDGVHKVWLEQKALTDNWLQRWWSSRSFYHRALMKEEKAMFESPSLKRVICNSNMVKQEILDNFSISPDKVTVIYNGVDKQRHKPANPDIKKTLKASLGIPEEALVFMFPGSGFARKNLANTITALSKLPKDCHLLVLGRDKKQKHYENLAQKRQCRSRVHFLGAQDRQKMPSFYQAADVLVLPTYYDPFPNVILEGLACGLPCITSSKCGAIDIIPTHHCGTIIKANDQQGLIKAMQHYQNSDVLHRESINATKAVENFSPENMQKQLLQLYSELLEQDHA